jgi:hypothetical protein
MKEYGGMAEYIQVLLTSSLVGGAIGYTRRTLYSRENSLRYPLAGWAPEQV